MFVGAAIRGWNDGGRTEPVDAPRGPYPQYQASSSAGRREAEITPM